MRKDESITKARDEVLTSDAVTLLPSEATLGVCLSTVQYYWQLILRTRKMKDNLWMSYRQLPEELLSTTELCFVCLLVCVAEER